MNCWILWCQDYKRRIVVAKPFIKSFIKPAQPLNDLANHSSEQLLNHLLNMGWFFAKLPPIIGRVKTQVTWQNLNLA